MKSERRRELKRNPLAVWTLRLWQRVQPHWHLVAAAVVVVVVVWLGTIIWQTRRESHLEQGWTRLLSTADGNHLQEILEQLRKDEATKDLREEEQLREALNRLSDELAEVVRQYSGTSVEVAGRLVLGDLHYALGISYLFSDLPTAREHLDQAVEHYRHVLQSDPQDPHLIARARFGLAKAYESRGRLAHGQEPHDWERASQQYDLLTRSANPYHTLAQERLEAMHRSDVHQWLWEMLAKESP